MLVCNRNFINRFTCSVESNPVKLEVRFTLRMILTPKMHFMKHFCNPFQCESLIDIVPKLVLFFSTKDQIMDAQIPELKKVVNRCVSIKRHFRFSITMRPPLYSFSLTIVMLKPFKLIWKNKPFANKPDFLYRLSHNVEFFNNKNEFLVSSENKPLILFSSWKVIVAVWVK